LEQEPVHGAHKVEYRMKKSMIKEYNIIVSGVE
jgi:hypothetical protein